MAQLRILHILAQRPGRTGSGITLEALVRYGCESGHEQAVVVGVPAGDANVTVGDLSREAMWPLTFHDGARAGVLDFPVPGMSDVMPYESTVYSSMNDHMLDRYERAWHDHLEKVRATFDADVVHVHHAWIVACIARQVFSKTPVVVHTHGTALRQAVNCPEIAQRVQPHIARVDHCVVLHEEHRRAYADSFGISPDRITIVGAGFREDLFHPGRNASGLRDDRIFYAGKLSRSKGVPQLIEAFTRLRDLQPNVTLALAGGGSGAEADVIRQMARGVDGVDLLGALGQAELAEQMRSSRVFVLPSLYEGLPLVLVEAAASGCRLVATALPGVLSGLAQPLADRLTLLPMPKLRGVDEIDPAGESAFVNDIHIALREALAAPQPSDPIQACRPFTWTAVSSRIERIWQQVCANASG